MCTATASYGADEPCAGKSLAWVITAGVTLDLRFRYQNLHLRLDADTMLTLAGLHIYPVKGLRGSALEFAAVEPWGLVGDRRWMVVDERGRFLSQREQPRLALIVPTLLADGLRLALPGRDTLTVDRPEPATTRTEVVIWHDTVLATPAAPEADRWLSEALGVLCRLVYMADPETARSVDQAFGAPGDTVSFADGFPLLVTTAASLGDLDRRLGRPVPMSRFRPNLDVGGGAPWDEDGWRRIRVGEVTFRVVKDCARCAVTTVDQDTGVRSTDNEPLRTLAGFRRAAGGRIIFGQNLVPEHRGTVRIGDVVTALG